MTPENQAIKQKVHDRRNELKRCPFCNSCIEDRKIAVYKGLIDSLYKIYEWCGKNQKHEFETKEIRHLLGRNEYARFGDLVRFGGIIYKPKEDGKSRKAFFGINMERAKEFFEGKRTIPVQITINQITGELIDQIPCHVSEFPALSKFIKENGLYDYTLNVKSLF